MARTLNSEAKTKKAKAGTLEVEANTYIVKAILNKTKAAKYGM